VKDLFALFPDLPWFTKSSLAERVREVQEKAERARLDMIRTIEQRKREFATPRRGVVPRRREKPR